MQNVLRIVEGSVLFIVTCGSVLNPSNRDSFIGAITRRVLRFQFKDIYSLTCSIRIPSAVTILFEAKALQPAHTLSFIYNFVTNALCEGFHFESSVEYALRRSGRLELHANVHLIGRQRNGAFRVG